MERIIVNLQTGEQSIVPFTPEEEAEALAQAAEYEARLAAEQATAKPTLADLQQQITLLQKQIEALVGAN